MATQSEGLKIINIGQSAAKILIKSSRTPVGENLIKRIENSKNYFVTDLGEIYSGHKKLKLSDVVGYRKVRIHYEDGRWKDELVHRLVAKAFIPNPDNKPLVNHKNLDKTDNRLCNLEWVTYSENNLHYQSFRDPKKRFETANSKYTEKQIRQVFEKLEEGWTLKDISEYTGISYSHVVNLKLDTRHKQIASEYKLPPVRSRRMSVNTVKWICHKLEDGFTDQEIVDMATSKHINRQKVRFIRNRYSWTSVSKDFNF